MRIPLVMLAIMLCTISALKPSRRSALSHKITTFLNAWKNKSHHFVMAELQTRIEDQYPLPIKEIRIQNRRVQTFRIFRLKYYIVEWVQHIIAYTPNISNPLMYTIVETLLEWHLMRFNLLQEGVENVILVTEQSGCWFNLIIAEGHC